MKKLYSFIGMQILLLTFETTIGWAQFTLGNLVVVRDGATGQGSAPTSAGTAIFLDEYTTAGVAATTVSLPTVTSGNVNRLVGSGSATSEGLLSLSTDGQYLIMGGYDAAVGTASVNSATSTDRVIARVDANGVITTTVLTTQNATAANNSYTTNNFRSVITIDGSRYWTGGNGTASTGGIRTTIHSGLATSVIATQVSGTTSNTRIVKIFNGQLFYSTGSGTTGIYKVGTGTPISSATASTNIITATDPYDFVMLNRGGINWSCYIANGTQNEILKLSSTDDGASWTAQGSISTGTGSANNVYGITGSLVAGNPVLYATRTGAIITLTDVSAFNAIMTGSFSVIVTAPANTFFRGIAFAPPLILAIHLQNISATNMGSTNQIDWTTGHEDRNDYFELQRSNNAKDFATIARINAKGSESNYSYEDKQPFNGINYYRLKMTDETGNSNFSQVSSALVKKNSTVVSLIPNPVTDKLTVSLQNASEGVATVTDLSGKILIIQKLTEQNTTIDMSTFVPGVYLLQYTDNTGMQTFRFTK